MARYDCVDSIISKVFYTYGKFVSRHKLPFLLVPLLVIFLSMGGLYRFTINDDVEYLFTPADSRSRNDLKVMTDHYLSGKEGEEFLPNRELDVFIRRGRVIISALDEGNVMRKEIFKEILKLDEHLTNFGVDGTTNKYSTLCMKWGGQCVDNAWLNSFRVSLENYDILINATYPFATFGHHTFLIGPALAGVVTDPETEIIKEASAVRLVYTLSTGSPEREEIASNWEDIFEEEVEGYQKKCKHIRISRSTSHSLSREAAEASFHVIPRFAATFCMMILFAVFSCIMRDWVLSKPWLGFLGVLSASFAIFTTVGIMSFAQVEFNEIVALMPFLVLGVGVDNMFIMISAWRHLSLFLTVEERMGRTFSEAAVSITITNLTDVLAFVIGSTIKLPGIRIFCAYAGVAMIFVYIYQITFFAACMAYMGDREANNLHCYTCKKVLPREESPNKFYEIFCAGGMSKNTQKAVPLEHQITKFFRLIYGPFIIKPAVKIIVIIGYLIYIGGAIYGCTQITQGLELKSIARDESPAWIYYSIEDEYFTKYGPSVSVVFRGPIMYWEETTQEELEKTLQAFERSDFIFSDKRLTVSWLRDFKHQNMGSSSQIEKELFLEKLTKFLENPQFAQYTLDLDLERDENGTVVDIVSSRFLVSTRDLSNTTRQGDMMLKMRELAEKSSFDVTVYGPGFLIYDQYIGVLPNTLQTLGIAMACMFAVAIVMIPHPICAVFVTLCVISIDTAVIGYMSLWHIPLDPISMLNIILCIGFSVDFSAHITYAFVIAPVEDPNLRSASALHNLGMPILQGALSTVIAISVLSTAPVYIFRIFFKTLFLVMVFGAMHGLVVLPVFLSYLGNWMPHKQDQRDKRFLSHSRRVVRELSDRGTVYKGVPVCKDSTDAELYVVELFVSTV